MSQFLYAFRVITLAGLLVAGGWYAWYAGGLFHG